MNLDLPAKFRRLKRKVTASGSPFRHIGKFYRSTRNRLVQPSLFKIAREMERELPPECKTHVANLRESGFSMAGSELDPELMAELSAFSEARLNDPELDSKKRALRSFMIQMTCGEDMHTDHVLVRFALQDPILQIATAYLGEVPYLSSVQIFQSLNTGSDQWAESQLWHLDYEDSTTVKVWVYLTDVPDVPQGPFTFLPRRISGKVKNRFFPTRISDETMVSQTGGIAPQHVKGGRLTSFYIDSSVCYHRGSRIHPGHSRLVYEATFVTHASLYRIESGIRLGPDISPLHRLVLSC